jgi:hypothetical protein
MIVQVVGNSIGSGGRFGCGTFTENLFSPLLRQRFIPFHPELPQLII